MPALSFAPRTKERWREALVRWRRRQHDSIGPTFDSGLNMDDECDVDDADGPGGSLVLDDAVTAINGSSQLRQLGYYCDQQGSVAVVQKRGRPIGEVRVGRRGFEFVELGHHVPSAVSRSPRIVTAFIEAAAISSALIDRWRDR